jgi:multimeric flavodoxin WrbA
MHTQPCAGWKNIEQRRQNAYGEERKHVRDQVAGSEEQAAGIWKDGGIRMKVLMLNGSPHTKGNTYLALQEMEKVFAQEGIETEIVQIGNKSVRGCIACNSCAEKGKCVFDDVVNELAPKFEACDGLVVGTPVYYASANATLIACLDRLFYSTHFDKTMKVGAGVVAARRGGLSATFDELNKYFTISGMPIASSQYWNSIHGRAQGEAAQDAEGLQIMRTLAKNMSFLMKSIALGKEQYGLPEKEAPQRTNFIR